MAKEKDEWDKMHDIWSALKERPNIVDTIWDKLPYGMVEFGLRVTNAVIKLEERDDNYSIIISDICESCLEKGKVSIKQFKCVINYSANFNRNNLRYKTKKDGRRN